MSSTQCSTRPVTVSVIAATRAETAARQSCLRGFRADGHCLRRPLPPRTSAAHRRVCRTPGAARRARPRCLLLRNSSPGLPLVSVSVHRKPTRCRSNRATRSCCAPMDCTSRSERGSTIHSKPFVNTPCAPLRRRRPSTDSQTRCCTTRSATPTTTPASSLFEFDRAAIVVLVRRCHQAAHPRPAHAPLRRGHR